MDGWRTAYALALCLLCSCTSTIDAPVDPTRENGLIGLYYDTVDFTGEPEQRLDPVVDFVWGDAAPFPSMEADSFSVRWEGYIKATEGGTYTFATRSDDGVTLWVDDLEGEPLIRNWTDRDPATDQAEIELAAGQLYGIRLDYYKGGSEGTIQLLWEPPDQNAGEAVVIPAANLFTDGPVASRATVRAADYAFVPPNDSGPTVAPIVGYNWSDYRTTGWQQQASHWNWPIYNPEIMDRNTTEYWDYLVDELLLARVDVVSLQGRGAWYPDDKDRIGEGSGDMDPRLLTNFVAALDRAGARQAVQVAMWDDTALWGSAVRTVLGGHQFDFARAEHCELEFSHNIKLWFESLPRDMWHTIDGGPVISMWSIAGDMTNAGDGNASSCLEQIRDRFSERFDVEPRFLLHQTWFDQDPLVANLACVLGRHGWFQPEQDSLFSYENYNEFVTGTVAPGFTDQPGILPDDPEYCTVPRDEGERLIEGLQAGLEADWIFLQGWTNQMDGVGFYRSQDWSHVNQYINIVRHYADRHPESLRFQAEGADEFNDTTSENTLGDFSTARALDVRRFTVGGSALLPAESGWYVGDIENGEWLLYRAVELGGGTYRFTARAATTEAARIKFLVIPDNDDQVFAAERDLPDTDGEFDYFHLGEFNLDEGTFNLRLEFLSGGLEKLDWFHLRRARSGPD